MSTTETIAACIAACAGVIERQLGALTPGERHQLHVALSKLLAAHLDRVGLNLAIHPTNASAVMEQRGQPTSMSPL